MPKVSVVMPVYNVEDFIEDAVQSVLAQHFRDFELLIIDDCSPDDSIARCRSFHDDRIQIIQHEKNRGLAGARNTGIRQAQGDYIAFLDSDDLWHPDKLSRHVEHLDSHPEVGISFSRSMFIEPDGSPTSYYQMPKLTDIDAAHCLCRNPVGNGSAPVIRRTTLEGIRYQDDRHGEIEDRYFDEDLRQSEDIECWLRILIKTEDRMEGLSEALTFYRLNAGGLSAQLQRQYASWETMLEKIRSLAPELVAQWEGPARAYQLRYLSRQAIRLQDGKMAVQLVHHALRQHLPILKTETARTVSTLGAAYLLRFLPLPAYHFIDAVAKAVIGRVQGRRIMTELRRQTHSEK